MCEGKNVMKENDDSCKNIVISEIFGIDFPNPDVIVCMRQYNNYIHQISDLPPGELAMLILIGKHQGAGDPLQVMDLVRSLSLSKPAVSRMLHVMEKKGLVCMTEDPDDHRRRLVTLAEEGIRVIKKEISQVAEILEEAAKSVGVENVKKMMEYETKFCTEISRILREKEL